MVTNAQASKWSGCRLFSKVCGVGGGSLEFPVLGRVSGKFLHHLTRTTLGSVHDKELTPRPIPAATSANLFKAVRKPQKTQDENCPKP